MSLIETLVAVFLTGIICSTLMLAVTQAKMYQSSIRIKEQAYIELTNYIMENIVKNEEKTNTKLR